MHHATMTVDGGQSGPGDGSQGQERRRGALTSSAAGGMHHAGWPSSLLLGLILPLVLVGLFELVLGASVLQTSIAVIRNFTDYGSSTGSHFVDVVLSFLKPLPAFVLLGSAVVSFWVAALAVLRHQSAPRLVGAGIGSAILLNVLVLVPLVTIYAPHTPRPVYAPPTPAIGPPQVARFGVVGRPFPGQSTRPVTVDRILGDDSVIYVQYHIADVPHDGQPLPVLFDDRGHRYEASVWPQVIMTRADFISQMMPWRASVPELGVFPPLHPGLHALTIQFVDHGSRVVQTVRVRLVHPTRLRTGAMQTVRVHGVTLSVTLTRGVTLARETIVAEVPPALVPRGGLDHLVPNGFLTDRHGHVLDTNRVAADATCRSGPRGGAHCETWLTFAPPPPAGTHVTWLVGRFVFYGPLNKRIMGPGPLRIQMVMP